MGYHVFTESEVNKAVIKKAPLDIKSGKKSKHKTAWLMLGDKKVKHLRIPNAHSNEFKQGKAGDLAKKMFLDQSDYKLFVECTMSASDYLKVLEKAVTEEEKRIKEELDKQKDSEKD